MHDDGYERAKDLILKELRGGVELGTDELAEKLSARIAAGEISPAAVRQAAWSLVDRGRAEFTIGRRLRAVG